MRVVALLILIAFGMVGCASPNNGSNDPSEAAESASPTESDTDASEDPETPMSTVPPPTMTPPTRPPTEPSDRLGVLTATGVLERGTSAGCVELAGPNGRYVLLGVSFDDWEVGQSVKVAGRVKPNMLSQCNGTVLRVTDIQDAAS